MKRKVSLKRKTSLPRVNRERAAKRKARDFGEYAEWIRTLPCLLTGRPQWRVGFLGQATHRLTVATSMHRCTGEVQAHHVKSRGAGGHNEGNLVPMCFDAHLTIHDIGRKSFASCYGIQLGAIAADLWGRYQAEKGNHAA